MLLTTWTSVLFEVGHGWAVFAAAHALLRQKMRGFAASKTSDSPTKSRLRIPPSRGLLANLKVGVRTCWLLLKPQYASNL
jgi:hypothetical protein